jgi:amino acid adenylation domain-containing protein
VRRATDDRGGNVALLLGKEAGLIAGVHGILRAGAALVPLDPSYPVARLRAMAADAETALMLTDSRHADLAAAVAPPGVSLLALDDLGGADLDQADGAAPAPDAIAVILYTSGSSGQPKGVIHSHASLLHNVHSYTDALAITAADRVAMLFGISAWGGLRDVLAAALAGAALLPYDLRARGIDALGPWLTAARASVVNVGVTAFRHLVAALGPDGRVPPVRALRVGGETITAADVAAAERHFPAPCRLHLAFGTTEIGNPTEMVLPRGATLPEAGTPVGYVRPGFEVRVVDPDGHPVPAGQRGEIEVRSRFLSPGYWHLPELTARCFVADDPARPELRRYRTGDLGVLADDGCLLHLGRVDDQVKIAGYRVAPAEVEAALLELPGVRHAVVAARERRAGETRLVAWVAPGDAPGMGPVEMRRALAARVPAHLVPAAIVVLPALPATPQGKVDRRALPEPAWGIRQTAVPPVLPRTPVERVLAEVWAEALDVDAVGVADAFLDLGGDSLRAGRLAARVNERFALELPAAALLEAATVAEMALLVVAALVQRDGG